MSNVDEWPRLDYEAYDSTRNTLHMYTQIIGKLRLALTPPLAQWAHAPLKLGVDGFTTGPLKVAGGTLGVNLDLITHEARFVRSDGRRAVVPLGSPTVADFYGSVRAALAELDVAVAINPLPQEVPDPVAFDQNTVPGEYDARQANLLWQAMLRAGSVMEQFQSGYWGKQSPPSLYWGGFDFGMSRFSGRSMEPPAGLPKIMTGSLDAEAMSVGLNFGTAQMPAPAFTAIAFPPPAGVGSAKVSPAQARWVEMPGLGGLFVLPYDDVAAAADPGALLLGFLRSTYEAVADLGGWDRAALERRPPDLIKAA